MNYAVIVVDMLKDNVYTQEHMGIAQEARKIIPGIQRLLTEARSRGQRIVYANDSFLDGDFIFQGRMKPHSLRGTPGAEVIDELRPEPEDYILSKRRMSAFFKTDLDLTLQTWGVDTVVVTGIATPICVTLTAIDAVASGFKAVVIKDCCAAHRSEVHRAAVDLYSHTGLYPMLQYLTLDEFLTGLTGA